jgi:hypothetical protein
MNLTLRLSRGLERHLISVTQAARPTTRRAAGFGSRLALGSGDILQAAWSEATFLLVQYRSKVLGSSFSNLLVTAQNIDYVFMPHFPQTQTRTRSPRVRVPNNEAIRFNLGGHQVSAVLQKISLTGGLAEFSTTIGSATIAEAKVNTLSGPVSGLVEFLPAQVGSCTYPFRFIALSDQDYDRLNATLQYMQKQGYGD